MLVVVRYLSGLCPEFCRCFTCLYPGTCTEILLYKARRANTTENTLYRSDLDLIHTVREVCDNSDSCLTQTAGCLRRRWIWYLTLLIQFVSTVILFLVTFVHLLCKCIGLFRAKVLKKHYDLEITTKIILNDPELDMNSKYFSSYMVAVCQSIRM